MPAIKCRHFTPAEKNNFTPKTCNIKLSMVEIDNAVLQNGVFVAAKHYQPSLIFWRKKLTLADEPRNKALSLINP